MRLAGQREESFPSVLASYHVVSWDRAPQATGAYRGLKGYRRGPLYRPLSRVPRVAGVIFTQNREIKRFWDETRDPWWAYELALLQGQPSLGDLDAQSISRRPTNHPQLNRATGTPTRSGEGRIMSPLHRTAPACLLKCQSAWSAATVHRHLAANLPCSSP